MTPLAPYLIRRHDEYPKIPPNPVSWLLLFAQGFTISGVHGSGDDALGVDVVGVVCGDVGGGESFVSKTRWEERGELGLGDN